MSTKSSALSSVGLQIHFSILALNDRLAPTKAKFQPPPCSGAPGDLKLICEVVTFERNLVAASKKFRFYTIKCSKYQKKLGRKCQF